MDNKTIVDATQATGSYAAYRTPLFDRCRRALAPFALILGMLFTASPAFASDYIRDFDWPNIDCWRILDIVDKLQGLADYLQLKADEARANGLDGLANAFESAAAEAEIEAAEGTFHLSTGDCVS